MSPAPRKTTNELAPIEEFAGWAKITEKLDKTELDSLKHDTKEVWKLLDRLGETELGLGEYLIKISDRLSPLRIFVAFVDEVFHMSRATAYRYMSQYKVGKKLLPEPILEAAIVRGTSIKEDVLERFVAENPPPKTTEPKVIQDYITKLENVPATAPTVVTDPELLSKEILNFARLRYARLEMSPQAKSKWSRNMLGLLATVFNIKDQFMLNPVVIPEEFEVRMGRPKQEKEKVVQAA